MKNLSFLFLGFLSLLLSGCETPVDLDLQQGAPRLAVEAIVTDQPDLSYVKLSLSAPYAKGEEPQAVTRAEVRLTDSQGKSTALVHHAGGEYRPAAGFKGEVGQTYTLTIKANGQTYTAASTLNAVAALDKVSFLYSDGQHDELGRMEGYYLSIAFQEMPKVKNYYKLDIVRNGELYQKNAGDILILDDKFYDGSYLDDVDIPTKFTQGDSLHVRLLSLNPEAYFFYEALSHLHRQGGPFGRNPANLPTNLSNGAVGFFSASAVSSRSAVIK